MFQTRLRERGVFVQCTRVWIWGSHHVGRARDQEPCQDVFRSVPEERYSEQNEVARTQSRAPISLRPSQGDGVVRGTNIGRGSGHHPCLRVRLGESFSWMCESTDEYDNEYYNVNQACDDKSDDDDVDDGVPPHRVWNVVEPEQSLTPTRERERERWRERKKERKRTREEEREGRKASGWVVLDESLVGEREKRKRGEERDDEKEDELDADEKEVDVVEEEEGGEEEEARLWRIPLYREDRRIEEHGK